MAKKIKNGLFRGRQVTALAGGGPAPFGPWAPIAVGAVLRPAHGREASPPSPSSLSSLSSLCLFVPCSPCIFRRRRPRLKDIPLSSPYLRGERRERKRVARRASAFSSTFPSLHFSSPLLSSPLLSSMFPSLHFSSPLLSSPLPFSPLLFSPLQTRRHTLLRAGGTTLGAGLALAWLQARAGGYGLWG